jgi:branched-chain amino acid transport system permease protein
MALALQQLINGLTLGSIYGLIAIGYTMVYGIIGMINFAHGDIFMVGAFIAVIVIHFILVASLFGITVPIPLALLLVLLVVAMLLTSAVWLDESSALAYRPLRGSFRLAPLISAIGMSIVAAELRAADPGRRVNKPIAPLISRGPYDLLISAIDSFTVPPGEHRRSSSSWSRFALMDGFLLARQPGPPRACSMRACEQDRKMAALLGVDVDRTISLTFMLGAALAAVAGYDVPAVLRRRRLLTSASCRRQGVHRGGARRHRLAARRDARRPADRPDRSVLVGVSLRRTTRTSPTFSDPHPSC